jgi:hypothetical protein
MLFNNAKSDRKWGIRVNFASFKSTYLYNWKPNFSIYLITLK